MAQAPIVLIMGPPGAGKGTQAGHLVDSYGLRHVATGDLLRTAVADGTPLGVEAKRFMDAGDLVPDDVIIGLIRDLVAELPDDAGVLLDGFPRTVGQAKALDLITGERPIDVVIDLDVPRELVLQRLSARRVCRDCGTNYMAKGFERQPWICDVCGGDVMHRDDDTPDAINRRLDLYEEQTSPLIKFYGDTGRLAVVDGTATPDQVFSRLTIAVEDRRRAL